MGLDYIDLRSIQNSDAPNMSITPRLLPVVPLQSSGRHRIHHAVNAHKFVPFGLLT